MLQRKSLPFISPSGEKCVNELLFHLPKIVKILLNVFYYDKETVLAPFNLAHPVDALDVLCVRLMRDLLREISFLFVEIWQLMPSPSAILNFRKFHI